MSSYKSINFKIILIFILLGVFLLTIFFVQIIPKMQKEQKEYSKNQIENIINLTTSQIRLATKSIEKLVEDRLSYQKSILISKLQNLQIQIKDLNFRQKQELLLESSKQLNSDFYLLDDKRDILFQTSQNLIQTAKLSNNNWLSIEKNIKTVCPKLPNKIVYTMDLEDRAHSLVLASNPNILHDKPMAHELNLKKDIQNSFKITQELHHGKTYLMWLNTKDLDTKKDTKEPLYNINDHHYFNEKYCLSKISNMQFPTTGLLSAKEIYDAIDKAPIKHMMDTQDDVGSFTHPAFTWVKSISQDGDIIFLYITTVLEEDFHNSIDSSFWKILPASLISLFAAILAGLFIFRRVFNGVNLLSRTAYLVNKGDLNIRSKVKGDDDIGILGITFDNMLDSLEKNINHLDEQVEQRTKEVSDSLEEKKVLLKEIHHRVKNNLAMTIELIKLQKMKIQDDATKAALTDIQERIYTMELLHRKLYETKDLHSIEFDKYIKELVFDLAQSYKNHKDIKIKLEIEKTQMDIDYVLPCGLIINECVTNSFKYAFEDRDSGEIGITLKNDDSNVILEIYDDGKGIPMELEVQKAKTLGLKLVNTIVKNQLFGTLLYNNDSRSVFKICFKIS